jgi:hypothetical protein
MNLLLAESGVCMVNARTVNIIRHMFLLFMHFYNVEYVTSERLGTLRFI